MYLRDIPIPCLTTFRGTRCCCFHRCFKFLGVAEIQGVGRVKTHRHETPPFFVASLEKFWDPKKGRFLGDICVYYPETETDIFGKWWIKTVI